MCLLYLINPVVESGDTGEDGGFLLVAVATLIEEAGDAVDLPATLFSPTVQRSTVVTLDTGREEVCFIYVVEPLLD